MKSKNEFSQKILIAGLGSIGQRHLKVLEEAGFSNISVTDPDPKSVQKALGMYPDVKPVNSLEAGLSQKPDAVFILTPPKLHIPMAIMAAESGCSIFCEKPLSDSFDQIEELQKMVLKNKVTFAIGLCFRYHAGILELKRILDSGRLGRLISIRSIMGEHFPTVRPDYKTLFSSKYSGAFDLIHDLDLALWFAGQSVSDVHCIYGNYSDIDIEAPDLAEIMLNFKNHCIATVHLDFFHQPRKRQIELICTGGTAEIDFSSWDEYTTSIYDASVKEYSTHTVPTKRDDMFHDEDLAFLRCVSGKKDKIFSMDDAILSLDILEKIKTYKGDNKCKK